MYRWNLKCLLFLNGVLLISDMALLLVTCCALCSTGTYI